jgi:hypothetical protein
VKGHTDFFPFPFALCPEKDPNLSESSKSSLYFKKAEVYSCYQNTNMFNNGTNKIITIISTILVVVVIIIPALNGGGI